MKKFKISAVFLATLILSFAFAAVSYADADATEAAAPAVSNQFKVIFDVRNETYAVPTTAQFELYDKSGNLLDTSSADIASDTYGFEIVFDVPQYTIGTSFDMTMTNGLNGVIYGTTTYGSGEKMPLETYAYSDETGAHTVDYCYMTALPPQETPVNIFIDYNHLELNPKARMMDGIVMVPVAGVAQGMGISDVAYSEAYNSVTLTCGKYQLIYNIGNVYTTTPSGDINIAKEPVMMGGVVFVPLESMIEPLMSEITYHDEGTHLDINVMTSQLPEKVRQERLAEIQTARDNTVNTRGIASDTNYLIWVSKAEYTMRVYTGSAGNWELIDKFLVGIGKPSTPTCVGQFRYYQYQRAWDYGSYYVGPVMRFNGGYAIHSVLMRYNGTEYDGRVGIGLSAGCVRVKADKMNWLASTIPMYTKIYITND